MTTTNFKPHPEADERRRSATHLINLLLANKGPETFLCHLHELLGILLWKITEADGKYNTRHKSHAARNCADKTLWRHDHVYTKKKMIDALLRAEPNEVSGILKNVIGCTVTLAEHNDLTKYDDEYDGWERYRKASVSGQNIETGEQF
jgi:hypothetical protein